MKIDISTVDYNALKLIKEVLVCYYDGNEAEAKSALHEIAGIVDLTEALHLADRLMSGAKEIQKVGEKNDKSNL